MIRLHLRPAPPSSLSGLLFEVLRLVIVHWWRASGATLLIICTSQYAQLFVFVVGDVWPCLSGRPDVHGRVSTWSDSPLGVSTARSRPVAHAESAGCRIHCYCYYGDRWVSSCSKREWLSCLGPLVVDWRCYFYRILLWRRERDWLVNFGLIERHFRFVMVKSLLSVDLVNSIQWASESNEWTRKLVLTDNLTWISAYGWATRRRK